MTSQSALLNRMFLSGLRKQASWTESVKAIFLGRGREKSWLNHGTLLQDIGAKNRRGVGRDVANRTCISRRRTSSGKN